MHEKPLDFDLYRRAHASIAQGALTNSKRVECLVKGVTPTHLVRGNGAYTFDVNGKRYIDFICSLGTNLFGHANPYITQTIAEQLQNGWLFSMGSQVEVEAAEMVKNYFQFVDKVRFLKTGTEACMAAIRIARAHTRRSKVLSAGYHGHADPFLSLTPPHLGVPEDKNIESFTNLNQIREDIACVILEPIVTEDSPKRREWLNEVKTKCQKNGVLLIFDEIITGFRWPRLSFSLDSGIYPDIICLGKAMGGGLPLSCVGLRPGIGNSQDWFVSGTYYGETLSLKTMMKVFWLLENRFKINTLWDNGKFFLEAFNTIAPEKLKIEGYPTRGVFVGDPMTKALFWQEACRAGILFGPSWFYGFQNMEHRDVVLSFARDILPKIKAGQVELKGELPVTPFAQKLRE